ncbi:MAG: chemotaxis protein CheD [Bacillota bacterium]|nr:chemotaxis protein CheD [Bacillota bacterium]HOB91503.1 chemotaxis protein CheD [Bacillota bacterium]HQD18907.1 chemotaxis protein CheD [Bacillota bacterium]
MVNEMIAVGLGEIKVSKNPDSTLVCFGLGSCVAVGIYDSINRIGGMAHVVLPDSSIGLAHGSPGKYADTAIPALIEQLKAAGARKSHMRVKIAGGAKMFASSPGLSNVLDVGTKNVAAVKKALASCGLRIAAEDCGGRAGRTFMLSLKDGVARVRTLGRSEIEL